MARVLVTAFEPYDRWPCNSSWLTLVEFTKALPGEPLVTTRLYPVDVTGVREHLLRDLADEYDGVLHLGQSPRAPRIQLEAVALNIFDDPARDSQEAHALCPEGPAAYRSALPLQTCARGLCDAGIPAAVSFHAGVWVCNATLYLSHYLIEQLGLTTKTMLLHVPVDPTQAAVTAEPLPSYPAERSAHAVRILLQQLFTA